MILIALLITFFYNVSPVHTKYPIRNFTSKVLNSFEEQSRFDWKKKYGDSVIGFESLVLPPRTGELYLRNSWVVIGVTKGFTCRRVSGPSTDGWGGRRIWDTKNIQPKLVLAKKI